MLKLIDKINNNGGLTEMEVDLKNGITLKRLEDLADHQKIFIIKLVIH